MTVNYAAGGGGCRQGGERIRCRHRGGRQRSDLRPNMATDWNDNGTNPCADPGDGREGRDRETLALAQEGPGQAG
ncbi:MAG: hypothetical protein WDN06_18530 [Asticcacaulis sp.]